jgi:phospholipid/cholesterol/gamma-HCH transport system substrate-binding protein
MASKAQSIRVGLFAAITGALLAIVLVVFGGLRFWEKTDRYRIVFDSSVIGLEPGAEVYMNGIKVGTVDGVEIAAEDIRKVAVAINVKRGTPIHADTHAMLQYAGITGLKVIDLRDGTAAAPTLPPGSQIAAGVGLLDKLETQAQAIVNQSGELMKRATMLTDNLIAVTDPARRAADNLATMSASLNAMVDENRAALRESIAAIRQTATGAAETFAAIRQTATGATELLDGQAAQLFANAGDFVTDLKKLITSNEGPLRAAVFDLRQASRSFKELARDVRQKPSRLLFSSEPAERQLP